MKVIDKKGRLFGIINVIDLMVLLVLVFLILGGVYRMMSKPGRLKETTKAYITYEVPNIKMTTISNLKKGDLLYTYDKDELLGTIVESTYEPYSELLEREGEWVNAVVPEKYTLTLVVKADVVDNPDSIIGGGEEIRADVQYRLKNKKIAFFATVTEVELLEQTR